MSSYTIMTEVGVKTDWNNFNTIQNTYGSKEYTPKRRPPKKLLAAVIREFEKFCADYHIDAAAYRFIEPCEMEGEWRQFDFIDDPAAKYPSKIAVHSIISNHNGKIFQRIIDIGS